MLRTITRAEFARLGKVSKPFVTKWLKAHPEACEGTRVRLENEAVVAYLRARGHEVAPPVAVAPAPAPDVAPTSSSKKAKAGAAAPTKSAKPGRQKPPPPTAASPELEVPGAAQRGSGARKPRGGDGIPKPDENGFVEEVADLTLVQICARYGTVSAYKAHLEAFEKRERALKYRLDNEEAEGRLIDRELVARVIAAFDGVNRKLLSDAPKTISRRLYGMARAEQPVEEAEATVKEIISVILKAVKKSVREVIDDGG